MSELIFRPATHDDLHRILSLYLHFEVDPTHRLSPADAKAKFSLLAKYPNYKVYVATRDNFILGSFSLLIMDNLVHAGTPAAIVEAVIVDPDYQKQGIGKAMMQFAMEQARLSGCYKLALSSNFKWGAAEFYEKLGFKIHGTSFYVPLNA